MTMDRGTAGHRTAVHKATGESLAHAASLTWLTAGLCFLGFLLAVWAAAGGALPAMPGIAKTLMAVWLAAALLALIFVARLDFVVGFLIALFAFLVGWRIAGSYGLDRVSYPLIAVFLAFLALFFDTARRNLRSPKLGPDADATRLSVAEWHLTVVRLYVGLDIVPHFTEKLFAGPGPRMADVAAFAKLGVPAPEFFVLLGGACELGIAIGVGLGLFTRLAAICSVLYMLIATVIGNHFALGFIWASPGGGWEYPVLWSVLLISFAYAGAGRFSLDHAILRRTDPPRWLRRMMVRTG